MLILTELMLPSIMTLSFSFLDMMTCGEAYRAKSISGLLRSEEMRRRSGRNA